MKTLYTKTSSVAAGLAFAILCCFGPVLTTAAPGGGAPANDLCSGAINIPVACGSTTSGTTVDATTDNDAIDCGSATISSPGVWYTVTGTGGDITASLCSNTAFDTKLSVFTGSCGAYVCVDGNDDACSTQSEVSWNSVSGTTYYILVHGYGGATGTFDLVLSCPPPANDLCANAIALDCGDSDSGSIVNATDTDVPGCVSWPGVWYSFVGDGTTYTIDLTGSDYDTWMAITDACTGTCLNGVGSDDLVTTFATTNGVTYGIYVEGNLGAVGNYVINLSSSSCTPPANDLCSNAETISCGDALAGTTEFGTEQVIDGSAGIGVWYTFTGNGGDVTLSTCDNATFDTEIHVLTSPDCSTFTQVARNDDATGCSGSTSEVTLLTTLGETYYVYVSHWQAGSSTTGTFTLSMTCPPPANNLCGDAVALSCGDMVAGSTVNADETGQPDCVFGTSPGVWYSFVGDGTDYTIDVTAPGFDPYVSVTTDCAPGAACVANLSGVGSVSVSVPSTVNGTTYNVYVVDNFFNEITGFDISLSSPICAPPANDLCSTAEPIACGDVVAGTTINATTDPQITQDCDGGTTGAGAWYTYVGNGGEITVTTCSPNSSMDTELGVYSGACGSLTCVVFDDDDPSCGNSTLQSTVTFTSTYGTTYFFRVAPWSATSGTPGDFEISVSCVCPNSDAGTLTADATPVCLSGGTATISASEATAPTVPTGFAVAYVLTDGDSPNLDILDASLPPSAVSSFDVTAGGTYIIHTLVFDPNDAATILGESTGVGVATLISDGTICGSLDVTGAPITVNAPEVGATLADATPVCLDGGSADIGAESDGNEVVPAGFAVAYVLTDADNNLEILDANATGDFTVTAGGNYIIHTLVYDPAVVTDFAPYVGQSATVVVGLISDGTICAALDVTGAPITVNAPEVGATLADATPVCLDGGSADIGAESDGNEVVPAGFAVAYVLTDADNNLEILDANATGDFAVTAGGNYIIHTLVYDPAVVTDFAPYVGQSATVVVGLISDGTICAALDVTGAPITVNEQPTATISGDFTSCNGASVDAQVDFTGVGPWDITLETPGGQSIPLAGITDNPYMLPLNNPAAGSYTLSAVSDANCLGTVSGSATVAVENPDAGTITADADVVCYEAPFISISATPDGNADVPTGYETVYLLVDANGDVVSSGATASFAVTSAGDYVIHTLVYDPNTLTPGDYTTAAALIAAITPTGSICASLDVTGAPISAADCPENDLCTGAIAVDCDDVVTGSTEFATADDAPVGPFSISEGVWYSFAGNGENVTVSLCSGATTWDTEISVSEGACGALTWVGGNDDACGLQSEFTFTSEIGTDYFIYVGDFGSTVGAGGNGGDFELTVTCEPVPDPPANDDCAGAIGLTVETSCTPTAGDVAGATESLAGCAGTADDDVWYSFVATAAPTTVSVTGSTDFDAVLEILDGSCGTLTSLECIDATLSGGTESVELTGLTQGVTYYVRVYDWFTGAPASTTFDVCVYETPPPPANDECSGAVMLTVGQTCISTVGTVESATESLAGCAGTANDDVWFSFVADATGAATVEVTGSSDFDAVLEVFDGACGSLTSLECIDATLDGETESVALTGLTPGNTYYVRVYHWYTAAAGTPTFDICVYNMVVGITEALDNGLTVYPNPSNGEFVVEINGVEADAQLTVLDLAGRIVHTEGAVLNGNYRRTLDLDASSGTYLLQVVTEDAVVTRKLQIH